MRSLGVPGAHRHAGGGPDTPNQQGLRWSIVAIVAGTAADAQSSWGRLELHPVLRGPNGRFGGRALAIKGAVADGGILAQWFMLRGRPRAATSAAIGNFGAAAILGGFSVHNNRLGVRVGR